MTAARPDVVLALPPRGLTREQAAAYIGVSPGKFSELVASGRMPKPLYYIARPRWDRNRIDAALDAMTESLEPNPHDE